MGLEASLAAGKSYPEMQREWTARQKHWKVPFRIFFSWPYYAKTKGPKLEGPALVVFDNHSYSSDPAFFVSKGGFRTAVAKEDSALLSRLASYFGGIMVPAKNGRESLVRLVDQLYFHLDQGHTIQLFPFPDVKDEAAKYGVIRAAMQWEKETGNKVQYFPATLQYDNLVPFFKQPFRMPWGLSGWPVPFLTMATLYISREPIFSDGYAPKSSSATEFRERLINEAASLPQAYQQKGLLSNAYRRARQFFLG